MLPTVLVLMMPPLSITNPPPGVALMSETLMRAVGRSNVTFARASSNLGARVSQKIVL